MATATTAEDAAEEELVTTFVVASVTPVQVGSPVGEDVKFTSLDEWNSQLQRTG